MRITETPAYSPEAAQAVERLESLRGSGWDITEKTGPELNAIEADVITIGQGRSIPEMDINSYSTRLMSEASEALKTERIRRDLEHQRILKEQVDRVDLITRAAGRLERAMTDLERAEGIEDKRYLIAPRPVDVITDERLRGMDGKSIESLAFVESMAEKQTGDGLDRIEHSASILEKHGGTRGKRLAKVLRVMAKESREALEAHRANIASIRGEQDARAERAKMEQRAKESIPETAAAVDDLLARVAELEEKLSAAQQ